ncbi:MAG: hypothetical protein HY577_01010 [Candidatus Nealsonbacteria bacterium]|nr:hypothetical protein [Candidatus Nealsonbacteria bacterium]
MKLYVAMDDSSQVLMISTRPPDKLSGLIYEIDVRAGVVASIKDVEGRSFNYLRLASSKSIQLAGLFDANSILNV